MKKDIQSALIEKACKEIFPLIKENNKKINQIALKYGLNPDHLKKVMRG